MTAFGGSAGFDWTDVDLDDSDLVADLSAEDDDSELLAVLPGDHLSGPMADPDDSERPGQHEYTEPDASTIGEQRRKRGAATYERKMRAIFAFGIKYTAQRPTLVADSATMILYSPKAARAVGNLAAVDPRVARGIDVLFEGTENPALNAALALFPLVAQMARNHEPVIQPKVRGFKIPFTKMRVSIPFRVGINIPGLRTVTDAPPSVADYVFSNPTVQERFRAQEIPIAWRPSR